MISQVFCQKLGKYCISALFALSALVVQALPQLGEDSLDSVVQALTVEQKINLVLGTGMDIGGDGPAVGESFKSRVKGAAGNSYPINELNIPSIVLADGPAGVRIWPTREDSPDKTFYGTAFPIASLLASSWDLDLIESVGRAIGSEARDYGIDVMLSPALNIHRYALGGRNFEYFSEDPLLSGKMSAAIVNGIQSQGVGTSLKHYVANNHEWNRSMINVKVSERALREIYLRGFEIAVKESDPWTIMSSYNKVNGEYTSESEKLLIDVLRKQWGYDGLVMTDWFGGINAVKQMEAGNDLLMPGTGRQRQELLKAIETGELKEEILDRNAKNVLKLVQKSLVFANFAYSEAPDLNASAEVARRAATEGITLLKNKNTVLPLSTDAKVAVFGNYSYDMVTGGTGSGDVHEAYVISLEQGLQNTGLTSANPLLKRDYLSHIEQEKAKIPPPKRPIEAYYPKKPLKEMTVSTERAKALAEKNDIALLTIGRSSGEFKDREKDDFYLTEQERNLIDTVSAAFHKAKKPVVVILNIGGVIEMASWIDKVDAILLAYQPGQEAGNAIADVLAGNVNPSGKLVDTFPTDLADYPAHTGFPGVVLKGQKKGETILRGDPSEVVYDDDIWVGYRYFNSKNNSAVVFPFGYGLSYTTFKYSKLSLSDRKFSNEIKVKVTVKNTGNLPGKEVVQLYLSAPLGDFEKPTEELRAFAKTKLLEPGESETLEFLLTPRDLMSFDEKQNQWIAHAGKYTVRVSASSTEVKATKSFKLHEALNIAP